MGNTSCSYWYTPRRGLEPRPKSTALQGLKYCHFTASATCRCFVLHKAFEMRQRITFLQESQHSIDPGSLKVTKNTISTKELKAAREDRVTFGFDELPQELYRVLKASHELHIRWIKPHRFDTIVPLVSRLSPGLHVLYTPQRNGSNS